uniref:OSJNBa0019J05.5 protein n=1 Tax=Oryza sativa subsp. japonica TaxID=39947 RepID=Q7X673_ORYSJ|nr:OSJNBa0071G03.16 [Oryza sativa Japonica Group]CAD40207.2 OSJNBa0019J05.5 [Oryza sativa Japonica Group]
MANLNPNPLRFLRQGLAVHASRGLTSLSRSALLGAMKTFVWPLLSQSPWSKTGIIIGPSLPTSFKMNFTTRDALVLSLPEFYDGVHPGTFVNHDQGPNWRAANFHREGWFMFLDFPLDFIDLHHVHLAVASFGRFYKFPPEEDLPPAGPQPGPDDATDDDPDAGNVWQFGNPGNQGAGGWDEAVQQQQAANEQQEDAWGQDHPMGQIEENPGQLIIPQQMATPCPSSMMTPI